MIELNLDALYRQTKANWLKTDAPRRDLLDMIGSSVPYWLIIVGVGFLFLSAPHTIAQFNSITPGFGLFGTLGVDFGILYAAFRRKMIALANELLPKEEQQPIPSWLKVFELLLIVTSILVNGAGGLSSVVNSAGIADMSAEAIIGKLPSLPLTTVVSLVIAIAAAVIVPAGAQVSGEGLATLVLQRSGKSLSRVELIWKEVEYNVIYRAIFNELSRYGMDAAEASSDAKRRAQGYLTGKISGKRPELSTSPLPAPAPTQPPTPKPESRKAENGKRKMESGNTGNRGLNLETSLQREVAEWLMENPARLESDFSGRNISTQIYSDKGIKVSHVTANKIKSDVVKHLETRQ